MKRHGRVELKIVTAVVPSHNLDAVREALHGMPDFPGRTVGRVMGCSATSRHAAINFNEPLTDFTPVDGGANTII